MREREISNSVVHSESERGESHPAESAQAGFSSAFANVVRLYVLTETLDQLQVPHNGIGC